MDPTNTKTVGGHQFPARPPGKGLFHSDQQRFYAIEEALAIAATTCRESQRALYELILPAWAAARTLKEASKHEVIDRPLFPGEESEWSSLDGS